MQLVQITSRDIHKYALFTNHSANQSILCKMMNKTQVRDVIQNKSPVVAKRSQPHCFHPKANQCKPFLVLT